MGSLIKSLRVVPSGATALWFEPDGWVPNSTRLPALHYGKAVAGGAQMPEAFEHLFVRNGWSPQWRNGIYDYHHYHSTAHEALGIAAGRANVLLGGPHGQAVAVVAGDCIVLPAGTGHCLLDASPDLLVVGAYPPGQDWDLRRDALSASELAAMAALPIPRSDPIAGRIGALPTLWSRSP